MDRASMIELLRADPADAAMSVVEDPSVLREIADEMERLTAAEAQAKLLREALEQDAVFLDSIRDMLRRRMERDGWARVLLPDFERAADECRAALEVDHG